jgi:GxxExxY protein
MHENQISERIIGAGIEVHRHLGPGLLESIYEEALCCEMGLRQVGFQRQKAVPIIYKGIRLSVPLRLDLIVEEKVIVDLKAKEELSATDRPQLLTYLRLTGLRLGLILNFHTEKLKDGILRIVNNLPEPLPLSPPDMLQTGGESF